MFHCHICGSHEAKEILVNEVFQINNDHVLVQNIPATVCERCGEKIFSRSTTERVRRMMHGEAQPITSVQMDVFAFS